MPFLFFLSYCGDDGRGGYVSDFYDDLRDEIRRRTTEAEEDIGFQYVDMQEGTLWRDTVSESLGSCRVFVPLYSPRYFRARFCGQEWGIFAERQRRYEQQHGHAPELIVPVLWEDVFADGPGLIPKIADDIWAKNESLAGPYLTSGMRKLVQHKTRYRDEYHDVVERIAGVIIRAAGQYPLPVSPGPIDFDTAPDVFQPDGCESVSAALQQRPGETSGGGPRHVHLVVAAPTAAEAAQKRTNVDCYGRRSEDWMPYLPAAAKPVVRYAMTVADEQDLTPHPVGVSDGLSTLLEEAESAGELVVLLVDAWATCIPAYADVLRPYDDRLYGNCAVLLPWNPTDEESKAQIPALVESVVSLFKKNARIPHPTFRGSLHSLDEFKQALREVLIKTQSFVFEQHPVPELVNAGAFVARPQLEGPGEA
ncbi:TIR-like protein FxsC [Micromonospora zamorensis]|uniref:TIR-like protein FxsC n=1 Tax=Micromonospora zamorensis TaxID=709883 RepID=UPI00352B7FC0|nr:TIR-like protein FxsC [Micromonospora zamorensis]